MSLYANRSEGQPAFSQAGEGPQTHTYHQHDTDHNIFILPRSPRPTYSSTGSAQPSARPTQVQTHPEHHKRRWLKQCHGVGWSCLSSWPSPPAPGPFFFPTVPAAWPYHGQNVAASLRAPRDWGRCRVPAPPAWSPRGSRCWRLPDPASGPRVAKPWKIDLLLPNHGQRWR